MKAAEADYANLKVTLEKLKLDMQSTVAQVDADYNTAKLQGDRDAALAKEGLFSEVDAKISAVKADATGQPPATGTEADLHQLVAPKRPSWPPPRSRWTSCAGSST